MRASGRITLFLIAGTMAGLLTWVISLFLPLTSLVTNPTPEDIRNTLYISIAFGCAIGILLGAADTLAIGAKGQWLKVILIGAGIGVIAGILGLRLASSVFTPLYVDPAVTPFDFIRDVVARALAWSLIGAFAGTADGWRKLSLRVGRNGFFGGLIGGLLGGTVFQIVPYLMTGLPNAGTVSRMLGYLITGAMIGLFIGFVQQLLKEAWVYVVLGKNEGREYLIERTVTRIGREETSDIPLFGNPDIAKKHALIAAEEGVFTLEDQSGSPLGVLVNGEKVENSIRLRDGDQIQVADRLLVFRERLTRKRTAPIQRDISQYARPKPFNGVWETPNPPSEEPEEPQPATRAPRSPRPMKPPRPVMFEVATSYPPTIKAPPKGTPPTTPKREFPPSDPLMPEALPQLIVVMGGFRGSTFPLGSLSTIGREIGVEIRLASDAKLSRIHARIVRESEGYVVEDLNSTNGTFLNGTRLTGRHTLSSGDIIKVGNTVFRYEADAPRFE